MDAEGPPLPDRFRFLRALGRGGFGRVDLVEDRELGREVALKRLLPGALGGASAQARALREARSMARVDHPGVVRVLSAEVAADGSLCIVHEYVPGRTLDQEAQGWPPEERPLRAARLARPLGEALDAVHAAGLVHRDVKPENVLVRDDGTPVLGDLGLARSRSEGDGRDRLTETGVVLGTFEFMDPAVLQGADHSPSSDLYALAATLLVTVTGAPPRSEAELRAIQRERTAAPLRLGRPADPVAARLVEALRPALGPRQLERYPSGAALAAALEEAVLEASASPGERAARSTIPSPAPAPERAGPRARWAVGALLVLAALVVGLRPSPSLPPPATAPAAPPGPVRERVERAEQALQEAARRLAGRRPRDAPRFGPLPFGGSEGWREHLRTLREGGEDPATWRDAEAYLDAVRAWHRALGELRDAGFPEPARDRWLAALEPWLLGEAWTVVLERKHLDLELVAAGLDGMLDADLHRYARSIQGRWEELRGRLMEIGEQARELSPGHPEVLAFHALVGGLAGDPGSTASRLRCLDALGEASAWDADRDRMAARVLAGLGAVQVTRGIPCAPRREVLDRAWERLRAQSCLEVEGPPCPQARRQWHRAAFGLAVDCPDDPAADLERLARLARLLVGDPALRRVVHEDLSRYVDNVRRAGTRIPEALTEHLAPLAAR